jgi:hypothetical protein
LLKPGHKESRVGFALEHLAFGQNFWHNIVFSDEKSSASGNIRVYRPQNVRYEERYVNQVENRKFSVNMWGMSPHVDLAFYATSKNASPAMFI